MMTLSAFRELFGEFQAVSDGKVQAALNLAEKRTDAGIFGELTDEAHGNLAADILASRPQGREARQKPETKDTVYKIKRLELETIVGGFRGGAI